jgi:hypothetical protein
MRHDMSYYCRLAVEEQHREFSPVTGPKVVAKTNKSCYAARLNTGMCGPDGKMWEPNRKELMFEYIRHISKDA